MTIPSQVRRFAFCSCLFVALLQQLCSTWSPRLSLKFHLGSVWVPPDILKDMRHKRPSHAKPLVVWRQ